MSAKSVCTTRYIHWLIHFNMYLLQAGNSIHRFDIICLSETYLENSYHNDDAQPKQYIRGGVCIYYRETLPVKVIGVNILNEHLVCELSFGSHRVHLVSIYRTPSQSINEHEIFSSNFEQLLTYLKSLKPHLLLVTGHFNVRSSSWWSDDIDSIEGTRLE